MDGTLFRRDYWAPTMCTGTDGGTRYGVMSIWAVFPSQAQTHRLREMENVENFPHLRPNSFGNSAPVGFRISRNNIYQREAYAASMCRAPRAEASVKLERIGERSFP